MKKSILVASVLSAVTLVGCGPMPSNGSYVSPADQNRNAMYAFQSARRSAVVTCNTEEQCKRGFLAAKGFIIDNSEMRVQHSDEMSVITYRPSRGSARFALSAKLVPVAGGAYEIRPDGECGLAIPECMQLLTNSMRAFKPYVSAAMK